MENDEEYYKSSSYARTRDIMSGPVRCIYEILALSYSGDDDFKGQEVPASDNNSWFYDSEEELNFVLEERQKEMELYNLKKERKHKGNRFEDDSEAEESNDDEKESFMKSYSGAMNDEPKNPTFDRSFEHVNQHSSKQNQEESKISNEKDDDVFTPIDANFNIVKNLLDNLHFTTRSSWPCLKFAIILGCRTSKGFYGQDK